MRRWGRMMKRPLESIEKSRGSCRWWLRACSNRASELRRRSLGAEDQPSDGQPGQEHLVEVPAHVVGVQGGADADGDEGLAGVQFDRGGGDHLDPQARQAAAGGEDQVLAPPADHRAEFRVDRDGDVGFESAAVEAPGGDDHAVVGLGGSKGLHRFRDGEATYTGAGAGSQADPLHRPSRPKAWIAVRARGIDLPPARPAKIGKILIGFLGALSLRAQRRFRASEKPSFHVSHR